jgi:hypothetical protein
MPKKDIDYQKSVIYKIEHLEKPELLYVGSTTDFIKRKYRHKYVCNNNNNSKYHLKVYQMIRENGGWDCFKIMIIKQFPCLNKIELLIEEEKIIKELKTASNKIKAHRTEEERQEYRKKYNKDNKDNITEYRIQYRKNNKDKMTEYYIKNKDKILERQKEINKKNYQLNKDKIKEHMAEIIKCDCGCEIKRCSKRNHLKSKKHLDSLLL